MNVNILNMSMEVGVDKVSYSILKSNIQIFFTLSNCDSYLSFICKLGIYKNLISTVQTQI